MDLTDDLKGIYANANVNNQLIRTIEISHPSFSQVWYLAQHNKEFQGKIEDTSLKDFQPWGFTLKLPDSTTQGQSNAKFIIDATDSTVLADLWAFKEDPTEPIVLNWREYFSDSPEIQNSLLNIKLMNIEFNYNKIQGNGSRPDIVNRKFPFRRYDTTVFIGLRNV